MNYAPTITDLIDALQFALILVTWLYMGKVARQVGYLSEKNDGKEQG